MAQQLVQAMKGEFKAENYKDEYREALVAVIEAKVAGKPRDDAQAGRGTDQDRRPHERPRGVSRSGAREADRWRSEGYEGAEKSSKVSDIKSGAKRTAAKTAAKAEEPKQERRRKTA